MLPDPEITERLTSFSNEIAEANAIMSLDVQERPPHLTLLHVDADREVADRWWSEVLKTVEPSLPVRLTGLMFAPMSPGDYYVPEGGVYFGLEAKCTAALRQAHAKIFEAAAKFDATPIGVTGDNFSPHVTLGVLQSFPGDVSLRSSVLGASFTGRLALGRLGSYGTFPEILSRA